MLSLTQQSKSYLEIKRERGTHLIELELWYGQVTTTSILKANRIRSSLIF
jgi:hypothetical protein